MNFSGRTLRFTLLGLLAIIMAASLAAPSMVAGEAVDVKELDDYNLIFNPDQTGANFSWTLIPADDGNDYIIYANATSDSAEWAVSTQKTYPQPVNATSPLEVVVEAAYTGQDYDSLNLTLEVRVYRVGTYGAVLEDISRHYATIDFDVPFELPAKKVFGIWDNFMPAPLDNDIGVFIINILIWMFIASLMVIVIEPSVKIWTIRTKTQVDDIIFAVVRTPVMLLVFLYGFTQSLSDLERYIGGYPWILDNADAVYRLVLVFSLFYIGYKLFHDLFLYYAKRLAEKTESKIDDIMVPVVEKLGVVIIALVGLGYILGVVGIDLTVFVAGGVVISMVLAFAAQETISNLFSGIFLLTDRPFEEKDIIILPDDDWYEVRKVGLRSTRLFRFKDATIVTIPNNSLANDKIANFTCPEDKGKWMKTYGVAYGSDVDMVKEIIHDTIYANPDIITDDKDLTPIIRFDELGDSSINFFILIWLHDRGTRFNVTNYMNTELYNRFNAAGIEIPFPHQTIYLRTEKAIDIAVDKNGQKKATMPKKVAAPRSAQRQGGKAGDGESGVDTGDDGGGVA